MILSWMILSSLVISLAKISLPLVTIYMLADIGSIGGGWISGWFIKRGWDINAGRKTALLLCPSACADTRTGSDLAASMQSKSPLSISRTERGQPCPRGSSKLIIIRGQGCPRSGSLPTATLRPRLLRRCPIRVWISIAVSKGRRKGF